MCTCCGAWAALNRIPNKNFRFRESWNPDSESESGFHDSRKRVESDSGIENADSKIVESDSGIEITDSGIVESVESDSRIQNRIPPIPESRIGFRNLTQKCRKMDKS